MTTGGGDTAPRHPRVPAAIALGPILHARHRPEDLDRIAAAVPGSRIVLLGDDGAPDGPLEDAEVLFRGSSLSGDHLDRLLARAPRVVWIHSASVGVERVLTPATLERGITVTNGRGVFSRPIAEYVLMMMLAVRRRLPALLELQRERTWQPLEGGELRDATVGIVGMGSIGRAVASYATVFGAHVIALRRHPELGIQAPADIDEEPLPAPPRAERVFGTSGLPELFAASDFVVLALPVTAGTEALVDDRALAAARPGCWLINVARGRLVDEAALLRALRSGPLGGAVLDAFRDEPLPSASPFYGLPNVIVTPHTSWSTDRVLSRSVDVFVDNLTRFVRGEPLHNVVDAGAGY
ncbi:MAG: D-2-hydroxyacid dehydrogenase [Chloroflexi bacterium]|nr:D-2-hydroxyacid dehydrogenase [Chloroflexota bacterium]